MNPCQNCGKLNSGETNFCRFCGTKFMFQQPVTDSPYDYPAPRPYAWKTDEFQTKSEARKTAATGLMQPQTSGFNPNYQNYGPAALSYQPQHFANSLRCPRCGGQSRLERRISTAGWITFAILLATGVFFWLCWIGLLIKEDVQVCQMCKVRTPVAA